MKDFDKWARDLADTLSDRNSESKGELYMTSEGGEDAKE